MNSAQNLVRSAHGIGQLDYHLEWCPKYRYNMLRQTRFKDFLADRFQEISARIGVKILETGIEDDHIHLVVSLRPTQSVSDILQMFKGCSAKALFEFEPKFRLRYRRGTFWASGKFYRTVGDVDLDTTRKYVREQDHRQKTLSEF